MPRLMSLAPGRFRDAGSAELNSDGSHLQRAAEPEASNRQATCRRTARRAGAEDRPFARAKMGAIA
eukprot:1299045-Pyramimonas_sp.AAC.1